MKIIANTLSLGELEAMAASRFGNLVKAVVDVEKEIIALDAELHSDLEALLLDNGSRQQNLWGINLYSKAAPEEFIEFDSVINMRPSCGNMSRGVDAEEVRKKIIKIINKMIIS